VPCAIARAPRICAVRWRHVGCTRGTHEEPELHARDRLRFLLSACSTSGAAARGLDGSVEGGQVFDANDSEDAGDSQGAEDTGDSATGDGEAGVASCSMPIAADAGVTDLADIPALCGPSTELWQFTKPCSGSLVVTQGVGVDCNSFWLFDAATGKLQATASGCNGLAVCTGGVSGFRFPNECFDPNSGSEVSMRLCGDGGLDAGDAAADGSVAAQDAAHD
jgi:hypothetical protein